jgi:hypothetical protein
LNINRGGWKKAVFIGCTHGSHINWDIANKAVAFADEFKPHLRVHLGDAFDTAAFRAGAKGSADESSSVFDDFRDGEEFLNSYRPNLLFMGNHEDRLFSLRNHHNAQTAYLATHLVDKIMSMAKAWKATVVEYSSIATPDAWRMVGDTLCGHGFMYGENCTRDHVEMLGHKVIHAHDHKAKMQPGRMVGAPMGYSVGTLADIPAMGYAKARRATSAWSGAVVFGEYRQGESKWTLSILHEQKPSWIMA